MIKHIIYFVIFSLCIFSSVTVSAKNEDVTLIVTSDGTSKDDATKNALRLAVEQTYGVFVSSNTSLLNDELIKDEIATVASGNIKKYNEVAYSSLDGNHTVTLEVTVSKGKLLSYAKSKGGECELDGAALYADIQLQELYKKNEEKLFENLIAEIEPMFHRGYDYKLDLKQVGKSSDSVDFECKITAILNENGALAWKKLMDCLKTVGKKVKLIMSGSELAELETEFVNEIEIYNLKGFVNYVTSDVFFLRSPLSVECISRLISRISAIRKDVSLTIAGKKRDISYNIQDYKQYHIDGGEDVLNYNSYSQYKRKKGSDCGQFKYFLSIPIESLKDIKNIKIESNYNSND